MMIAAMLSSFPEWVMLWMNTCRYPTTVTVAPPEEIFCPANNGTVTIDALCAIVVPAAKKGLPDPAVMVNGGLPFEFTVIESVDDPPFELQSLL